MKKILLMLMILIITSTSMAKSKKTDEGVVINGVRWATRNVDKPGTFAKEPENFGKFYQWNRNIAYSTTGSTAENWDDTRPEGDEWEKANDPSPAGWRVPTQAEIWTLFDDEKVSREWISRNGVNGLKFTDEETGKSIFLPAAGYRINIENAKLYETGLYGHYWSSMQSDGAYAYGLYFGNVRTDYYYYDLYRADSRTIRAVAE